MNLIEKNKLKIYCPYWGFNTYSSIYSQYVIITVTTHTYIHTRVFV